MQLLGRCKTCLASPRMYLYTKRGIIGGSLGGLVSFLQAALMLEISNNSYFAAYFGILFTVIGVAIAKRVTLSTTWNDGGKRSRIALGLLAADVIVAGAFCFFGINRESMRHRIAFYVVLGVAVSFAVTFALADLLNSVVSYSKSSNSVLLILISSCATGAAWGLIFGLLDAEDDPDMRHALIRDEWFCAPLGLIVGGLTAVVDANLHVEDGVANDRGGFIEYTVVSNPMTELPKGFDDGL